MRSLLFLLALLPLSLSAQTWSSAPATWPDSAYTTTELALKAQGTAWRLQPQDSGGTLELLLDRLESPARWYPDYEALTLSVQVPGVDSVTVAVRLRGARAHLPSRWQLAPGSHLLWLSLDELPLTGSHERPERLRWEVEGELIWENMSLQARQAPAPPLRDRFGQRYATTWPEKVQSETDLRTAARAELARLDTLAPPPNRSHFGGWTGGPRFEATGHFRLEKGPLQADSLVSWWLVDPAGYPFWSMGVTGLRHKYPWSDVTRWGGRESWFEALPDPEGPFSEAHEDSAYGSFYTWNVLRKWGSLARWREVSFRRLQSWGLNTLGNWAHETVLAETPLPYTRALQSNGGGSPRIGESRLPDAFDPAWRAHLDTLFQRCAPWQDDSLLLGYFVDNELPWNELHLLERAGPDDYVRQHWQERLEEEYGELAALNAAWGTTYPRWEAVGQLEAGDFPDSPAFRERVEKLERAYAEAYFSGIAVTLERWDPHHLYLGARFTRSLKPSFVIAAAGRWCDVLSINVYSYEPIRADMDEWHHLSGGLPMLIGEHHVTLRSPRQLPPNFQIFDAAGRRQYYENYVQTWASLPYAVGCHWYQYKDQPLTGRGDEGERRLVGLVDITDQPYDHLVEAIRAAAAQVYGWHASW
jgi:hypothetical protein